MFSLELQEAMKLICVDSIREELFEDTFHYSSIQLSLKKRYGVFVSLKHKNQLRGCIGSIESRSYLYESLYHLSKKAAFSDHRFSPLSVNEFSEISIEISVLSTPLLLENYKDIVIGKHGIILNKGRFSSVFLPQVPVEWGWGIDDYLIQLSRKAGLADDGWRTAQLRSFTAFVF